jgi:hypothetical protein
MRKTLAAALVLGSLALGGCAAELQKLQTVYSVVTQTSVPPTTIIVAANSFDALEATATQYLSYCKANLTTSACSATNRRTVIQAVRAGRAARNQLETYVTNNTNAPSAIYNALVAAINTLNTSPVSTVGASK